MAWVSSVRLRFAGGRQADGTASRGIVWSGSKKLRAHEVAQGLSGETSRIGSHLHELNGFFLLADALGDGSYLFATDKIRSMPVFFSDRSGQLVVSDDPYDLCDGPDDEHEQVGVEAAEFLMAGYVTGPGTLDSRIQQLQAGEYMLVTKEAAGFRYEVTRYFEYRSTDQIATTTLSDSNRLAGLERAVDAAISRLISYANGRTIVIPLSGGRDSRLVALKLRQLEYPQVVCFSYGNRSGIEARVSSHVAGQLGFAWKFVPYNSGTWEACRNDPVFHSYRRRAHALCAVEHVQDWPAVKVLRNEIPDDSIFVPGHTHDFLAGGHLPQAWESPRIVGGWGALEKVLVRKHFSLWPREMLARLFGKQRGPELWSDILGRAQASLRNFETHGTEGLVQAFEFWNWRERQAKFIVNSTRVYESFGFDWWLPWFDDDISRFWASAQLSERFGKRLLNRYVDGFQDTLGVSSLPFDKKAAMLNALRWAHALEPSLDLWHSIRSHGAGAYTRSHPMQWYSLVEPEVSRWGYSGAETVNSYLSVRHVEEFAALAG